MCLKSPLVLDTEFDVELEKRIAPIDRRIFRRATVLAKAQLLYGSGDDDFYLDDAGRLAVRHLRKQWQKVDVLACCLSPLTPEVRSRIECYPLC